MKNDTSEHNRIKIASIKLLIILFAVGIAAPPSASVSTAPREALEYFFHQSFNNLEEEAEIAQEEGKLGIFVMFNDPDCPWCKKMKATVLNQVPVQEFYRKHFRLLHLDTRGDTMMTTFDGQEIAEKDFSLITHRVRATPVLMFFDTTGKMIFKYTGATRNVQEFLWMGEFVINGDYKKSKFSRYKRERLKQSK